MVDIENKTILLSEEVGSFNPLKDLFTAQSNKPAQLGEINLRALTPFQRALLVIDGTVTKFIEAYSMEPVEVIRLSQNVYGLPGAHNWLQAPQGMAVIAREVLLRGGYSHNFYAYAASLILPERLSEAEKLLVEKDGEGLGRILLKNHLETYREILWYGKEHIESPPAAIRHLHLHEFLSRTYRIFSKGEPIMLINEKFPINGDRLPSHH